VGKDADVLDDKDEELQVVDDRRAHVRQALELGWELYACDEAKAMANGSDTLVTGVTVRVEMGVAFDKRGNGR
jgi:hypothetical protein